MFRLIGGPARCGKSTLAAKAEALGAGDRISVDSLKYSLAAVASTEYKTALNYKPPLEVHDKQSWLDILRARDKVVWIGAQAYLNAAAEYNDDVLMEGLLWPDYVSELRHPYKAVYMVDTSPAHAANILAAARSDSTHNNWMKDRSDEWIAKWAEYNIERSKLYIALGRAYSQPVFDVAEYGYDEAQQKALEYLF